MTEKIELYDAGVYTYQRSFLGCVELPANTTVEEAGEKLKLCWADWREEVPPNPYADSEFIAWLVNTHGWVEAEGNHQLDL